MPTLKSQASRSPLRAALIPIFAVLVALTLPPARAQTSAPPAAAATAADDYIPTLTFDVASIRPTNGVVNSSLKVGVVNPPHASKFEATNFSAKSLIQMAYGFGLPISNGPDWLSERYFNLQARSDPAMDAQLAKLTDDQAKLEKQHMLQVLLADRLHLKVHTEVKESSVYLLTIAKSGLKFHESKPDPSDTTDSDKPKLAGALGVEVQAHGGAQGLEFDCRRASMKALAGLLTSQLEMPVIDKTNLPSLYDFNLQIGRDWSASNPDSWPSIFTAVQEQLGLKLDATKIPVPVLIIDHVEPPSEN